MTSSSNNPLPQDKLPDSISKLPMLQHEKDVLLQLIGFVALLLSVIGPFFVAIGFLFSYLTQGDLAFTLLFRGVTFGPLTSGMATLLGLFALPNWYGRTAICICGLWWAWWIYAVTRWSWTI